MVNLCIPTLTRYDLLAQCIESAMKGSVKPEFVYVIDNGGKFEEHFGPVSDIEDVPIGVLFPKANYGVGRSFNHFLHNLGDNIIVCNDDVIFHENTIELLVKAAESNPNELFFVPDCYWEHYWSCFLQKKDSLAIVGEYDGNFYPGYFEDRDYKYRMKLKGYKPFVVKDCKYTHHENGSNTIKSSEVDKNAFNQRFAELSSYYTLKWGGLPESEAYSKPFNLIGN